jgi:hypothetical protein
MRQRNLAVRLQPSLVGELRKAAEAEGVALNQLVNVAVAEKVSALRTEDYFQKRAHRANRAETLRILERAGRENPLTEGDELPADWPKDAGTERPSVEDSAQRSGAEATDDAALLLQLKGLVSRMTEPDRASLLDCARKLANKRNGRSSR